MLTHENKSIDAKTELANFEQAVSIPCIPGELELWLSDVTEALDELSQKLLLDGPEQSEAIRNIAAEDSDLMQQVDKLKVGDAALRAEFRQLRSDILALRKDPKAGPEETVHRTKVPQLVERSLQFVVHARQQFSAMIAWWMESLNRDRGVGD